MRGYCRYRIYSHVISFQASTKMYHQHIIKTFFDSDLLIQLYQSELGKIRDIYRGRHLHHHSSGKINLQYQSASSVCSMGNIIVQSKVPGLQQVSARILQLVYRTCTQETNISRLGKRKIIFKRRGIPVWSFY